METAFTIVNPLVTMQMLNLCATEQTCLQDFLVNMKQMFQNYYKILKKCFLVTDIRVWIRDKCLCRIWRQNFSSLEG